MNVVSWKITDKIGTDYPVGLDYSIWPGQSCRLRSSLSDLLDRLPARARSDRLSDGAGPAWGVPRMLSCWCSGT